MFSLEQNMRHWDDMSMSEHAVSSQTTVTQSHGLTIDSVKMGSLEKHEIVETSDIVSQLAFFFLRVWAQRRLQSLNMSMNIAHKLHEHCDKPSVVMNFHDETHR